MKRATQVTALAAVAMLALAACGDAPDDSPGDGGTSGGETSAAEPVDYKACMVSDSGGFDDQSFNEAGFEGMERAKSELGVEVVEVESTADTDYVPNIDNLVQQDCDLIIGVGFLLEDPIQAASVANPDIDFALIDSSFSDPGATQADPPVPVTLPNAKPILFNTAEAAFLAGYLAAGITESDTVATFGGIQIPSVAIFMDGFVDGVAKYNEDNGTSVKTLGWDKAAQTGSFTGDFENQANGQNLAQGFINQGADIVMPVAGPVGLGAAAAAQAADAKIIWVDSDGFDSTEYGAIIPTSVVKEIGQAVFDTIKEATEDNFSADPYVGTLENEGVALAPFHDFDATIPQDLKDKIADYQKQIISGDLKVESTNTP